MVKNTVRTNEWLEASARCEEDKLNSTQFSSFTGEVTLYRDVFIINLSGPISHIKTS